MRTETNIQQKGSAQIPNGEDKRARKQDKEMKIIERRLTGKQSQEACEDGIVATNDFVAVIDGSTSKTPKRISEDMKNGRYAMLLIGKYIAQMPAQTSLTEFCTGITGTISDIYCSKGFDLQQLSRNPQERITASAVIYSKYYNEIWMVGDCLCMVDGKLYENSKPYEDILAERRATIIRESDNKEKFFIHDSARDVIMPDMLRAMQEQNKTYAVIDGFPIQQDKIKVVKVSADTQEVVLASDGYPFLCPTLAESEARLKEQIVRDPLNINTFKATKGMMTGNLSFDDRAYIRFSIA